MISNIEYLDTEYLAGEQPHLRGSSLTATYTQTRIAVDLWD